MTDRRRRARRSLAVGAAVLGVLGLRGDGAGADQVQVLVAQEDAAVIAPVKIAAARPGMGDDEQGGPDLVRYRPEISADIAQAERFVAGGDFANALAVYLALLKEEAGAVMPLRGEAGKERLFVGVLDEIQRRIGALPPAGLQRYRAEVDPIAVRLFEQGRNGDLSALLEVVDRYRHSSAGAEAVELAAARLFDRTEFAQAARLWELWLREMSAGRPGKATVLLRLATAYHYLGRSERAAAVLKELRDNAEPAGGDLLLGGRRTTATVYLENVLRNPPALTLRRPSWSGGPDDWPGPTGNPSGSRPTPDADVVLQPLWSDCSLEAGPPAEPAPVGRPPSARSYYGGGFDRGPDQEARPIPAVVDGRVYIRYPDALRVVNLAGGRTLHYIPLEDEKSTGERGRLYVTVAEGRMYTVERFPHPAVQQFNFRGMPSRGRGLPGNRLTARDVQTGQIVWQTGGQEAGDDEQMPRSDLQKLVDASVILTAPTYSAGRLYAVAASADAFHALCLDAGTGRPVWAKYLSHRPTGGNSALLGSPPAVSGGAVYCLTNAGTVGALDETTGRVLWIFQYADAVRQRNYNAAVQPPNPPCVVGDRLYLLPSDSSKLYCLWADTGETAWHAERGEGGAPAPWLAGVARRTADGRNSEVVVLAGRQVRLYTAAGGKLAAAVDISDTPGTPVRTLGRPALSTGAVYLSVAERGVARVDLNTGATTYRRLPAGYEKNGVPLGTLLPTGGRLIACDKAATGAYAPFAEAFKQRPPRSAEDHFRWGLLALGAREFEQARRDFTAALDKADAHDDPTLVRRAKARLYQTHLLLAGGRTDPSERLALLQKAASLADSAREVIETRLHLARALAAAGRWTEALDTAQSVVVDFPATMIESEFRSDAIRAVPAGDLRDSREVAQAIVGGIVAGNRSAYGRWDAAAQADFQAALRADPDERLERLTRILHVYPHAAVADRVLHRLALEHAARAAATVAGSAAGDPTERRDAELRALRLRAQSIKYLDRIVREHPGSSLRPAALAGLVMLDALMPDSSGDYGRWCLARLAELPPDTLIESADGARRTVRDFLSRYGSTAAVGLDLPADIPPERAVVRRLASEYGMLVRGVDGRPLTHDGKLFLLTPQGLELHDPATGATVWRAAAPAAAVPDPAAVERAARRRPVNVRVAVAARVGPAAAAARARRPDETPSVDGGGAHFAVGGITSVGQGAARRDVLAVWDGRRVVTIDLKNGRLLWAGAEGSLVGSEPAADFYNGMFALVLSGSPSSAALVDPARQTILRPTLTNTVANDVAPALGPGGAVFASSLAAPNRPGFDLVDSTDGASTVRRDLDAGVQRLVRSPTGALLHLAGGRLSVCDVDGRTLWTVGGATGRTAVRLLHHDAETVIAVFADTEKDLDRRHQVVCLDVGTGRVLWRSPGVQEAGIWAVRLVDRFLVMTSTESPLHPTARALSTGNSVRLTAYSVRDGKPLWTYTINEAAPAKPAIVFSRPIVTRTQAVVFVRSADGGDGRLVRIDHETGKAVGAEAFSCPTAPEIVAGHLVCESSDGIRLYGKAGPLTKAVGRLVRALESLEDLVP